MVEFAPTDVLSIDTTSRHTGDLGAMGSIVVDGVVSPPATSPGERDHRQVSATGRGRIAESAVMTFTETASDDSIVV